MESEEATQLLFEVLQSAPCLHPKRLRIVKRSSSRSGEGVGDRHRVKPAKTNNSIIPSTVMGIIADGG